MTNGCFFVLIMSSLGKVVNKKSSKNFSILKKMRIFGVNCRIASKNGVLK